MADLRVAGKRACWSMQSNLYIYTTKKLYRMSLLNQQNNKGKKKGNKKSAPNSAPGSKFIQKAKSSAGFVSKQANTGSQRGS